jgi:hypothetical protein
VSGSYASTWTSLTGFTSPPSSVTINWQRLGNVVQCSLLAVGVGISGLGINTATVTLPVLRALPFTGALSEAAGEGVAYSALSQGGAYFTPTPGGFTAQLNCQIGVSGTVNISCFLNYLLAG